MTNMNKEVVFKMHLVETAPEAHDEYLNARRGQMITAVAIEDGRSECMPPPPGGPH